MAKNWAIVIGINHYTNLQSLKYAHKDAQNMEEFFREEAGFDAVFMFTDDSPAIPSNKAPIPSQPTYGHVRRFLRFQFEEPLLEPGDNLWFFFSGHGLRYDNHDYLLLSDTDPGDVEYTALSINYITQRLRRSGADNVVLLLDACRNPGGRAGEGIGRESQQGVVTIYSCSPNEIAYEIASLEQGTFTYCLLEALRIQGEGNCATVERLDQYLHHRVPEINLQYQKPQQQPYVIAEPVSKHHLILLPRYATLRDIETLKLDACKAELEKNWELAKQLWIRVNVAAAGADMDAINAFFRIAQHSTVSPPPPQSPETSPVGVKHWRENPSKKPELNNPNADEPYVVTAALTRSDVNTAFQQAPSPRLQTFSFDIVTVNAKGKEIERHQGEAHYFTEDLGQGVNLEMVVIPAGSFWMGSPDTEEERCDNESPQHQVTVASFCLGKYPVTQAQWQAVVALPQVNRKLYPNPSAFKGKDLPVEQVSWYDAAEFCARLSQKTGREYRLPSEAEREYACRAGTTTPFHFGETISTELANYNGNYTYGSGLKGKYRNQTTSVDKFKVANAFGLYDMHGNVGEWCADHWHDDYQGAPIDGSVWSNDNEKNYQSRILRGGSRNYYPTACRSAFRDRYGADGRNNLIGFRVVCSAAWTL
ncbi:MAG: SUMF1/EgtB/PvdO family nonheme iron enzyme [Symploca sp. SIO2D2]|nr:SUMF1/EgtB/PvdO family nonheme iron enzyme [Symploca sp. SIO2D2]